MNNSVLALEVARVELVMVNLFSSVNSRIVGNSETEVSPITSGSIVNRRARVAGVADKPDEESSQAPAESGTREC